MRRYIYYIANMFTVLIVVYNIILMNKGNIPNKFDIEMVVWLLLAFTFGLYNVSPYLFMLYIMHKHANSIKKLVLDIIILMLLAFVGIKSINIMKSSNDAQSSIALLFIPIKLWLIVIVGVSISGMFRKYLDKS